MISPLSKSITWARAAICSTSAGGHPCSTGIWVSARVRSANPRETLFVMAERSTPFVRFLLARAGSGARSAELHEDRLQCQHRLDVTRERAPGVFDPFERADEPGRIGDCRRAAETLRHLCVHQRLIRNTGTGE